MRHFEIKEDNKVKQTEERENTNIKKKDGQLFRKEKS